MTELAKRIVDAYNEKDFNKCEASLLFLALAYNSDIEKGKVYDHDLKHLMFAVNFIRNPLGARYALEDYTSIKSVLFGTIQTLKMINNPENDTSDAFHKELVIDKRIIDDLIDLATYTYVLYQMNQVNSKRMDDCETWKLPFVEQLLTIFTFFQDQVRILRQDPQTYLHDDYITGMELSVADRPVEYYDSLTSSISDNFESMLEATNELIHYLYFQYGKNIKSEELIENINFDLIRPYGNVDFQRYMYIAGQRTLLRRIEEGIRYGYYSFDSTGRQENGFKYFLFILEDDNKYRARRLGLLRREYQYQNHALMYSLSQPNLAKAYELLTKLADMLVKIQTDKSLLVDISQFHPDSELFQKAEKIAIPKLGVVESLTKDYYLGCQVKGVKISDFLCTYRYLFTLAEVFNTTSLHLIDQDIPSTYVKEVCLVNISYLSSELSRIHNYELKYAEKLIDRFVFHEKNNRFDDVFAQPLLKISNSQVVLSQALMEQVNLDRAIERQFIRFNKNISEVGRKFEEYFINSLSCGYVQSPLDFQRKEIPNFAVNTNKIKYIAFDGKDIEFDMIAMLGDYIMETKQKNSYFDELGLCLKKDGFTVLPEENGILPVRLDNRRLCCVTDVGAVRYHEEDIANEKAAQACDRVMDIAAETAEYVRQMESAPFLKVGSLEGNYKLLAEFNGTVLAGHPTWYGMEFITWDLIQNNTALWQGHYYSSYTAAKQDFASRAGLIDKHQLFSPEQLTEIYRSVHKTLDEAYPITEERKKLLESVAEQIEYAVPDLDKRVQEFNQKEMEVAEQGSQPSMTQQF